MAAALREPMIADLRAAWTMLDGWAGRLPEAHPARPLLLKTAATLAEAAAAAKGETSLPAEIA